MRDKITNILSAFAKAMQILLLAAIVTLVVGGSFAYGYLSGVQKGTSDTLNLFNENLSYVTLDTFMQGKVGPTPAPVTIVVEKRPTSKPPPAWTGPELWQVVNDRRIELGVNPLGQKDEICTIASIRLNEVLELGKLDAHEGFSNMPERREDLKWIFDQFNLAEFLLFGAQSPEEAVSLWENTLGHKKLLTGGEYVWGCIYAQNSFAVAITAF